MTNKEDIEKLNEKMDIVLKVLQDFGLNIIQNIGGLKHSLGVLTNMIEKLNKNMIFLKGLGVKLEDQSKLKESIDSELKYIQTLIKAIKFTNQLEEKNDETHKDISPQEILLSLKKRLNDFPDLNSLISNVEFIQKQIFEITGGHRVCFEINSEIKTLKKETKIGESLIERLDEKITFWINKLGD